MDTPARCRGIDVAQLQALVLAPGRFQPQIDWHRVRDEGGNTFAVVRLTYGRTGVDAVGFDHLDGAREARLRWGVYHVLTSGDPKEQAQHFASRITAYASEKKLNGALPHWLMIDDEMMLEEGIAPGAIVDRVLTFEEVLRDEVSRLAQIVYYSFDSYIRRLGPRASELAHLPLHLAKYEGPGNPFADVPRGYVDWTPREGYDTPAPPNWGTPWTFLQYIGGFWQKAHARAVGGRCPGVPGVVDKNLFRGTYADLWRFCGLPGPAPEAPPGPAQA